MAAEEGPNLSLCVAGAVNESLDDGDELERVDAHAAAVVSARERKTGSATSAEFP